MRISIIGSGYVGLTTGVGFALKGHEIWFVDVDKKKVDMINKARSPIYEPGLEEALRKVHSKDLVRATLSYEEAIKNTEITFIAVPTPTKDDGSIDLKFIEEVSRSVGEALKDKKERHLVVVKSTVLPGITENVVREIVKRTSGNEKISFAMNPEFLREGRAMEDVLNPDRVVIGVEDGYAKEKLLNLYKDFVSKDRILIMPIRSAELVKYSSNAFLSMKISYANLIGRLAKRLGVDVYEVMDAVGMDKRIGRDFLNAGLGFGGSCFPKDVKALSYFTKSLNVRNALWEEVLEINETQIDELIEIMKSAIGDLKGKEIVVLGLSFKPNTDDVRESRALKLIRKLIDEKVGKVYAHDPIAIDNAKKELSHDRIEYVYDLDNALRKADIVVIATEWEVYKREDLYKDKIVFDGRRVIKGKYAKYYEGLSW